MTPASIWHVNTCRRTSALCGSSARSCGRSASDSGFSDQSSFVYAAPDCLSLTRELEYALSLGAPARLVKPEGLPFPVREALCFERQAQLSPLPFLAALLPELTVYEHSPVRDIRRATPSAATAAHGHGGADRCRHALPHARALWALRPAAAAGALVPPCADRRAATPGMWLDAGEEGWSLRRSGRYLLLGGGGHRCGENLGDSYDRLRAQAQRLFPAAQEAFAWSSQDCMTLDGVPYIGPYSSSAPFLHVATGFGKWGMTGSMVAATLLTARLTGEDYPYADIFSPQRFSPSASISAFWEGAGYAVRGIGRRLFVPAQTAAADIARGHGGIVAWQGKKYGVYRHTDGTLFAVDIRCPHRGCELTWNDDEKSSDCPCHGSRFDYTGRQLASRRRPRS